MSISNHILNLFNVIFFLDELLLFFLLPKIIN